MTYFLIFFLALFLDCTQSLAEPADSKAYLQMIYENKGGYLIPTEEASAILRVGGHPQYGEIPYDSAAHLLDDLNLTKQDIFYDLGSGVGKLVLQVYLTTPVKRSIGVELSTTRWNVAESSRKQAASDEHLESGRDLIFLNQNIQATILNDVTVCFISGVSFPLPLIQSIMNRLSTLDHEVKVISILPLPTHKQFQFIKTYNLPMSWAPEGVDVCLYQVTPTPQPDLYTKPNKRKKRTKKIQTEED